MLTSIRAHMGDHPRLLLAALLLAGVLVRLPFAGIDTHLSNDISVFTQWARMVETRGLGAIYQGTDINYPPLTLYLLGGAALLDTHFLHGGDSALIPFIKLPGMLSDVATAGLLAWAVRRRGPRYSLGVGALYLFNPAVWYVSTLWGQTDAVYTLPLVASVVALQRERIVPAWVAYALALATKPQSLALAPVLAGASLARQGLRGLAIGAVAALLAIFALALPWLRAGNLLDAASAYTHVQASPWLDVSGYNLWYLLYGGQVRGVPFGAYLPGVPFSNQVAGLALFAALAGLALLITWRRAGNEALAAAVLCLAMYVLLAQVRERYLFPVPALLLLAAAQRAPSPAAATREGGRGRRRRMPGLWWAYGLISLTFLFNLVTIAPFTTALGPNLIVTPADTPFLAFRWEVALLVAALNLCILIALVIDLARNRNAPAPAVLEPAT
jgi:Gpi18-like mannosyltransferase